MQQKALWPPSFSTSTSTPSKCRQSLISSTFIEGDSFTEFIFAQLCKHNCLMTLLNFCDLSNFSTGLASISLSGISLIRSKRSNSSSSRVQSPLDTFEGRILNNCKLKRFDKIIDGMLRRKLVNPI